MKFVKHSFSILFILFFSISAHAAESELLQEARDYFEPLPDQPTFKEDNKASEAKLRLGKMLFFEPRLSKSGVFSCNSCHNLATGGVDNTSFSTGHKWQLGGRNAPTVLNASLHIAQFWDGRAADVEAQAQGPILADVEMAATKQMVLKRLSSIPQYLFLFQEAFPDKNQGKKMDDDEEQNTSLTYPNVANAIGAYERTLLTPSRFDKFLKGDETALNKKEKAGLKKFIDTGCIDCHNGLTVGGNSFQKFGVVNPYERQKDKGRYEVTKNEEDMYVFKVPSLRNIELTYPYFHDGGEWRLDHAIQTMAWTQLGVKLTIGDANLIEGFLRSLTGEPQEVTLPHLPPSSKLTPQPEHD